MKVWQAICEYPALSFVLGFLALFAVIELKLRWDDRRYKSAKTGEP